MPLLQRVDVGFGFFAQPAPNDRSSLLVHFEHFAPCGLLVETENLFEDHYDIGHQIDGIVEHNDPPEPFQCQLGPSFLFW